MKKQARLFELIKSMNQGEKRSFRMLASSMEKQSIAYIELFDAIEKLNEYDEQAVKSKLACRPWIKNFASTKNYLYNVVLKAIRVANSGKTTRDKIAEHRKHFKLLLHKGLFELAEEELNKAMHLAENKLESDYELIPILMSKNDNLIAFHSRDLSVQEVDELTQRPIQLAEQYVIYLKHVGTIKKVLHLIKSGNIRTKSTQNQLKRILKDPILNSSTIERNHRTHHVMQEIYALVYRAMGSYRQAADAAMLSMHHQGLMVEDQSPSLRLAGVRNIVYFLQYASGREEFEQSLNKYRKELVPYKKSKSISDKYVNQFFHADFLAKLCWLTCNRQIAELRSFLPKVRKAFMTGYDNFLPLLQIMQNHEISKAYWLAGDLVMARHYLNETLDHHLAKTELSHLAPTRMLELKVLYHEREFEYFGYRIKNSRELLKRKNQYFLFEKTFFSMMAKLVSTSQEDQRKKVLQDFHAKFSELVLMPTDKAAFIDTDVFFFIEMELGMHAERPETGRNVFNELVAVD